MVSLQMLAEEMSCQSLQPRRHSIRTRCVKSCLSGGQLCVVVLLGGQLFVVHLGTRDMLGRRVSFYDQEEWSYCVRNLKFELHNEQYNSYLHWANHPCRVTAPVSSASVVSGNFCDAHGFAGDVLNNSS